MLKQFCLWVKVLPGANDDWINGNIFLDRDVFGAGDWGDWGASLTQGKVMFGAADVNSGATACGVTSLADGQWHHLALTRRLSDGQLVIWLDGEFDSDANGPTGDPQTVSSTSAATPLGQYGRATRLLG